MLSPDKKRESVAGKLLLSSALVAVSLAYGWWQRDNADRPALATAPAPLPPAPGHAAPKPDTLAMTAPAPVTPDADAPPGQAAAPPPQKSVATTTAPQTIAPSAAPAVLEPQQNAEPSASTPPLTTQQAMQLNLPTDGASPPFPLVIGNPNPGATVPLPAGGHLEDGDYVSDKHSLMWGDLRVKISIRGGVITGAQVLQFPDHRSQSLYLSQLALPILESEVIKNQKSLVDVVSSATDTSYTFQDAVADAITKATRG